ncbi:uncharacterized protein EKO05_0002355 [Ascochyta rabiei]|uniref:DNA binding n=1 Tax=Didymella rabiei TaxID=5454 RepID=A0A162VQU0_DIDRA|nr:uncharacterized protein EKO05_0002355 [Ascochyta rabiei]KZM18581.1 DNA binding [Ascochyta rabiei]UPX11765.1 hypothetical protein EKO05_0002355 [Ascochyta rabiei]
MSQISNTLRRPSTAQPGPLSTRMSYEAGEALLWERQNHRVNAHLSTQVKELQAQNDAYNARIAATESVSKAAEAAVSKVKQIETRIAAIEADDQDRPFDAYTKEAISQIQIFVDSHKGVRQKLSGLEQNVITLSGDVEDVRDVRGLLSNVVRRLDVLEDGRREEKREIRELEKEVEKWRSASRHHESVVYEVEPHNPMQVFYGVGTQPRSGRQSLELSGNERHEGDCRSERFAQSPEQRDGHRANDTLPEHSGLQPPHADVVRPEEGSFNLPEAAPETHLSWENTQQFKDMQAELAALRAMCRTQEPKSSGQTADATQRPQETIIMPKEHDPGFSDATTATEADSHIQLPSSPPKRHDTQSARQSLMKRPSIYDPRVASVNEHRQVEQPVSDFRAELGHHARPSLVVKLPVVVNNRISAKRKRADDAPAQRVTRPKFASNRAATREPEALAAKFKRPDEESTVDGPLSSASINDAPPSVAQTRKTRGQQNLAVDHPVQQVAAQSGTRKQKPRATPVAKPIVSAAETVKSRKAISKPKPVVSAATQDPPPQAGPSSSKKTPTTVKIEVKSGRQPPGACMSCRLRHQKCDRTHPACERCVKLSIPCEYSQPVRAVVKDTDREQDLRGRSVTVSPEATRDKRSAKRQMPALPSKKSVTTAAPTAASTRAPRAKKAPNTKAPPKKQK